MKKVFISQPMSGLTIDKIIADRKAAKKSLEKFLGEEVEVIDNLQLDKPEGTTAMEYMSTDIYLMDKADVVYFTGNWKEHRGCEVEHYVATKFAKTIITEF